MATTPTTAPQRVSCWRWSETTWMLCWTSSAKRSLFSSLRVKRSTRNLVGRENLYYHKGTAGGQRQSCLIQDEPGAVARFSHKMSLGEKIRMLGVDNQRANRGTVKPG